MSPALIFPALSFLVNTVIGLYKLWAAHAKAYHPSIPQQEVHADFMRKAFPSLQPLSPKPPLTQLQMPSEIEKAQLQNDPEVSVNYKAPAIPLAKTCAEDEAKENAVIDSPVFQKILEEK